MVNKLDFLSKELVDLAIIEIDSNGIPKHRESVSYTDKINDKNYPFKLLISEAAKIDGIKFIADDF